MRRLVPALEAARSTRSRKAKVAALKEALARIAADEGPSSKALAVAARLILGELQPGAEVAALHVGWALLAEAARAAAQATDEQLMQHARGRGDLGDGICDLLAASGHAGEGLSLTQLALLTEALAAAAGRDDRLHLLTQTFARTQPDEAGYLAKALLGEMRIGVQLGILEEAIAAAFSEPLDALRRASALIPDIGELATLAAQHRLGEASIRLGVPVAFMLATPIETVKAPLEPSRTVAEDKLDGIRAQAHVTADSVRLFARGSGEVSASFPDVAHSLAALKPGLILDGEIIAVLPDGRPRPFQALQQRLGRVAPSAELMAQVPLRLFAFDVLYDGESLLDVPFEQRRAKLEAIAAATPGALAVNPAVRLDAAAALEPQLDALFAGARSRGHEGLVLKSLDSTYEAGRRGAAWRKVKRALATLDVVITKAEWGHGKRHGVLSDYTFAVWHQGQLLDVGKAYSGLTDAEIAAMTERLIGLTVETRSGVHVVKPEVVLEVAFDGLQKSRRHASGYALRFPRIARIRDDKRPEAADTLATVEAMFQSQVKSGHREE